MKLILVRHAEAFEGDLTIKGVKQAIEVGAKLFDKKIETIYCSAADRCHQTMEEILRNRNDDIKIHLTSLMAPKMKSENYEKLKSRVKLFLDDLRYDHEDSETILIVSHQLVIAMIILELTGKTKKLENGEVMEINSEKGNRE